MKRHTLFGILEGKEWRLTLAPWRAIAGIPARLLDRLRPVGSDPEPPDVPSRFILLILLGWAVFLALSLGGLAWSVFGNLDPAPRSQEVSALPKPQLQVDGKRDLDHLTEAQNQRLTATNWVDPERTLIQIPIERAMDLVVTMGPLALAPLGGRPVDNARARSVEGATDAGALPR